MKRGNTDGTETISLAREDWFKLLGVAVSGIVAIAGAALSIAVTINRAAVIHEARMTKVETRLDVHDRDLEQHDRRISANEAQLRAGGGRP